MPDKARGTVIFDLDGTLVDSAPDLADALDLLLIERGHAPLGLDRVRGLIGHGVAELVRKGLAQYNDRPAPDELAQSVQRFLKHYTVHLSRKSKPYPGAVDALTELRQAGYRLVVCTNKLEASARGLLQDLGLLPAFALVAGPDTFGVAKPDPAHLLRCLPDSNPASFPAVVVGDSEIDLAAARAANLPIIAATWGYARQPLAALNPDALVSQLSDVPAQVDRLIGSVPRKRS